MRQVKGRPQVRHTLLGRSALFGAFDLVPDPFFASATLNGGDEQQSPVLRLLLLLVLMVVLMV